MFNIGSYGGFYWHRAYTYRLCLGWIAITFIPEDIDDVLSRLGGGDLVRRAE
jgi:hypothetical protein